MAKHYGQDNQHINGGATHFIRVMSSGQANAEICDNPSPALNCNRDGAPITFSLHGTQDPDLSIEAAHPLGRNNGQENAIAFAQNSRNELRLEGGDGQVAGALSTGGGKPGQGSPMVAMTQFGDELAGSQTARHDSSPCADRGQNVVAQPYSIMPMNSGKDYKARETEVAQPLMAGGPVGGNQGGDYIAQSMAVRRLTPTECERLQGFPDGYTAIPWRNKPPEECPDGPRYKALGNSMAVPVMRWIGERIDMVNDILASQKAIDIVAGMNCSMTHPTQSHERR